MNYNELHQAVQSAAGLRLRLRLQPMYGAGEIVFPSTYSGGGYLISDRRIPGYDQAVKCAILDSVQSQANRMEDALAEDIRNGNIHLPHAVTDFSEVPDLQKPVGRITSLETPHRIFDAIIRDSELNGQRFPYTDAGKAVVAANGKNATALFQYDPTSLLFGSWDSTGVSGGLGEKYTRCVVSELVAVNCEKAARGAARVDPLNASKGAMVVRDTNNPQEWKLAENNRVRGAIEPSKINHGNIPPAINEVGGITCDYITQSTTVSFPALRQLRFPVEGKMDTDAKAHAVLAAIALHAAALNVARGWHLRSRCDLVLDDNQAIEWEILGNAPTKQALAADATRELLKEAIAKAKEAGLPWESQPLMLKPSKSLADLVRKSQQLQRESETTD
ncbi:MAG: type I-U CRISPR-associated protein Cas7 [Verrucomicrobia bacterium]|nr:type I-U CRISPR-associated protein Cas7 [Verrucomicrobiota bacterium]